MEVTAGRSEVAVGLIDGPVAVDHPDLATEKIRNLRAPLAGGSNETNDPARTHGTYVAGILSARRGSAAPAICPDCTLLVRPIFLRSARDSGEVLSATSDELADAIVECINAGAKILNLSVAIMQPSPNREQKLEEALNHAARRGTLVVAAAGNQGTVGGSAITQHPWVIAVAACDDEGRPMSTTNLGSSIGQRGVMAPGNAITSLGLEGQPVTSSGTSAATPLVTGTAALLWSAFPAADAVQVRLAVTEGRSTLRRRIVPPLLNARAAYERITTEYARG